MKTVVEWHWHWVDCAPVLRAGVMKPGGGLMWHTFSNLQAEVPCSKEKLLTVLREMLTRYGLEITEEAPLEYPLLLPDPNSDHLPYSYHEAEPFHAPGHEPDYDPFYRCDECQKPVLSEKLPDDWWYIEVSQGEYGNAHVTHLCQACYPHLMGWTLLE